MRHRIRKFKLNRKSDHRRLLLRNLATSLVENGKVVTTLAKARFLRSQIEALVSLAKRGDLAARRRLMGFFLKEGAVQKLLSEVASLFREQSGGYTRLLKLGERRGDRALLVRLEWVRAPAAKEKKILPKKEAPKEAEKVKVAKKIKRKAVKK